MPSKSPEKWLKRERERERERETFYDPKKFITLAGVTPNGEKSKKKFFFDFFFRELSHSDAKNRKKFFLDFFAHGLARNLKRPQNGSRVLKKMPKNLIF